jgi:hypothetical protein
MSNNTTGNDNTAVGYAALAFNGLGDNNTGVGSGAGRSNTSGSDNTAIGVNALYTNNSGVSNTVLGVDALYSNALSSFNTAIGRAALLSATGSSNTALGYNSGNAITTGSNNVILGSYTGSAAPISVTGSNWIVLSDGAGSVRQAIDSAGNSQFLTGAVVVYAPDPAPFSGATTLTNANLQKQILSTNGTSFTLTMPLGTTLDTLVTWAGVDLGFDFSLINIASGTITMASTTGVSTFGGMTITTGTSARFRIRRTAASTYVLYRIA